MEFLCVRVCSCGCMRERRWKFFFVLLNSFLIGEGGWVFMVYTERGMYVCIWEVLDIRNSLLLVYVNHTPVKGYEYSGIED